jgi:hypothetical protein
MADAKYFDQLVDDIREAAKRKPEGDQRMPDAIVPNKWREQYPGADYMIARPLAHWFGLTKDMFPPADYWDADQLQFMVQILTQLYRHFNFEPMLFDDYSDNPLPHKMAYETLVKGLDIAETYYKDNLQPVYFCEDNVDTCPFGYDYCHCEHEG